MYVYGPHRYSSSSQHGSKAHVRAHTHMHTHKYIRMSNYGVLHMYIFSTSITMLLLDQMKPNYPVKEAVAGIYVRIKCESPLSINEQ